MRRHAGKLILVVLILGGLGYGFAPRPVAVDVARVSRGPLEVTLEEEGKTRVIDRYVVSAPVAGIARRIELDVGDEVARDDTLALIQPLASATLDPRARAEAEARVAASAASLRARRETADSAAADARFWQAEHARMERLFEAATASREQLERAEAEARRTAATLRSAEFAVEVARHELEAARTALRYAGKTEAVGEVAVTAPVGGRVLAVLRESEGVVQPGEPLVELGDPASLEVEVEVLSPDAVRVGPGTAVLLERWGGEQPLEARVRLVEPVGYTKISALGVEEQRVRVIADITSARAEWQRLGDGYRVEAKFLLWRAQDVLQVPASALFRHDGGWAVFGLRGDRAARLAVEVGRKTGLAAELLAGLEENGVVVVHPDESVEDGTRVEPR